MAILIADTKLETETDAWYQFYVDKMSDIADLPTSQSTGASYKVCLLYTSDAADE